MDLPIVSGVYRITNTANGKFYVGSAVNLRERWTRHKYRLRSKQHHNEHLQRSFLKHGEECFVFDVLELVGRDALIEREQYWIDTLRPEYNLSPTAGNIAGYKHTEEHKQRMSKNMTGVKRQPLSEEHKRKIAEAGVGRKCPQETRNKLSAAHKGKPKSEEHRRKISESLMGHTNTVVGRKLSDETRAKISAAKTGKKASEESRKAMSERRKGKPVHPNTLAALKASNERQRQAKLEREAAKQQATT